MNWRPRLKNYVRHFGAVRRCELARRGGGCRPALRGETKPILTRDPPNVAQRGYGKARADFSR